MIPGGLLPIGMNWMVAGGWAVCPALANDQDVFVLLDDRDAYADMRADILLHLNRGGFVYEELTDERTTDSPGECDSLIRKVAKVTEDDGRIIHVLIGLTSNPEAILNTFDLSICQIGILSDGTIIKGDDYTPPTVWPKIVKNTPTTDARLAKYAERFNLKKARLRG